MSKKFTVADIYSSYLDEIEDLRKQVKRLQEQLKEANEVIKNNPALNDFYMWTDSEKNGKEAKTYLDKWGVK